MSLDRNWYAAWNRKTRVCKCRYSGAIRLQEKGPRGRIGFSAFPKRKNPLQSSQHPFVRKAKIVFFGNDDMIQNSNVQRQGGSFQFSGDVSISFTRPQGSRGMVMGQHQGYCTMFKSCRMARRTSTRVPVSPPLLSEARCNTLFALFR